MPGIQQYDIGNPTHNSYQEEAYFSVSSYNCKGKNREMN
jgi:hypothetical protein